MSYARGSGVVVAVGDAAPVNAEIVRRVPGRAADSYVIRVRRRTVTVSEADIVGPVPRLVGLGT